MIRWTRLFAPLALLLAVGLLPAPARAQAPKAAEAAPTEEEGSGDPMYGYVATSFLAFGIVFLICRTARR